MFVCLANARFSLSTQDKCFVLSYKEGQISVAVKFIGQFGGYELQFLPFVERTYMLPSGSNTVEGMLSLNKCTG